MNLFEEGEGRLNGLEQLQSLITSGRRPPIGDTLDFALTEVAEGRAVFEGVPGPRAYNPLGVVHGGYAATLLDSACGCAVHASLTANQAYTTLELKIQFHRAITVETARVRAEGKLVTLGRRVAFAEARLLDTSGRIYASASSTLLVFAR
jgi:uncharacterized protein (TIGR00369 family)